MKKILKLLLLTAMLPSCVNAPRQTQALPTDQTFNAPKNVVWPLLISDVGLNYPVKAVEKESGLLTTDFVTIPAGFNNMNMTRWVFPPNGFLATWDGFRMNMSVLVTEPEPGRAHIVIRTHYEAFENNVSHSWIVCQSNGTVEHEILAHIAEQLPKPR